MARRPRGEPENLPVEFVDEAVPVDPAPRSPKAGRWVLAVAVALLAAVVTVAVLNTPHHTTRAAPRTRPTPSRTVHIDPPSRAIRRMFAQVLPGSVVVAEQSRVGRIGDGTQLRSRILDVVVGNVQVDVVVQPAAAPGRQLPGSTRLHRGAYVIDFAFSGYYPPSPAVLRALADDPRLIATDS